MTPRIVLLSNVLSQAAGGLSESVPGMARALEAQPSVDVHVVGLRDPAAPEAWRSWGTAVHAARQRGPAALRWAPEIAGLLDEIAPDLVDAQGLWVYPSLASLRHHRRTGRPHVVTPRGMLDPWALRRSRWKKRIAAGLFEDAHLGSAACIRATAVMEAQHVRAYGLRQPIAVVPNGVLVPDVPARVPDASGFRRLLFLSRMHPKKGVAHLLRAWARVQHRRPDWELVLAGPDEVGHQRAMQALAAELRLERLRWPGPAYGPARAELYRDADLFVLPTHGENFGQVVAEALAAGVPVVTTRNAPWAGLETHGCGWWVELSEAALAEALAAATDLPDAERAAMGRRGRDWMTRDFGWEAVGRQMLELYRWVLGGGPPPATVLTD